MANLRLVVLPVVALVVIGCGSSSKSSSSTSTTSAGSSATAGSSKLASELPPVYKSGLTVAADATYAPDEFVGSNGHTVMGMDADLATAIAKQLGTKAKVVNATFDSILPGLAAGKYSLGMSSFTDTKDRENTVDFVTYFSAGTSFFVKASGGPSINTLDDLCGHNVSVEKGTTQLDDATKQDGTCKSAGKPGVNVLSFDDQNGANLALSSGRADVSMADSPVAAYQVKQSNSAFALSGQPYGTAPYGIAIPKGNGMAQPVLEAIKLLMTNGQYKQILDKWGIASGAIDNPTINGATS